jgi:hypothetical protein
VTNLISDNPWKAIKSAARRAKEPSNVAVAYFGSSGDKLLPLIKGSHLVVDASIATVRNGITSPTALLRLHEKGVHIHTKPLLHAKVFAFDKVGFVGSTNASKRSENYLTEAIVKIADQPSLRSIRDFTRAQCTDRLNKRDLKRLEEQYAPPVFPLPNISEKSYKRLLVQIVPSDSQGYSGHQVQPPLPAWQDFFGVTLDDGRNWQFRLRNISNGEVINRRVVKHAQVMTLDIPESAAGSILEIWYVGPNRYDYRVVSPGTSEFRLLDRELKSTHNPRRHSGRLWIVT